ncbi:response regulator [Methylocucumis oryzae]|uniref:Chemotaxis protein CheY n=1 Tax=Methylocucumis oryzae TaxID=1632867 RepID=A0A0F3IKP4_9GAMM|nr:response regulator [Methylocucumis oryzae]KJV07252.1 chemotaxis protein CheY [Methylocucumis oryzae]
MSKKILVIEDTAPDQQRLLSILHNAGRPLQLITADNGVDGLAKARLHQPDLIFLDVLMPEMDGFCACRQLTTAEETRHIPVIIVSQKNQQADHVWAQLQGACTLIGKPYSDEQILAELARLD